MSETSHGEIEDTTVTQKSNKTPKSIPVLTSPQALLFLIFLACKLQIWIFAGTEIANWSWWWVTCPLWILIIIYAAILACGLVLFICALVVLGIVCIFDKK